jgi:hypothetical protein
VKDFDAWKPSCDAHEEIRKGAGLRTVKLMRNIDAPQEVWILFEASDLGAARGMTQSDDLRQVMEQAGVIDKPDFTFLDSTG